MKKYTLLFVCLFAFAATFISCTQEKKTPRIGIVGILIESSTFSPALSRGDAFTKQTGEDMITHLYPFLQQDSPLRQKAEWLPAMTAYATPGGAVPRETYDSLLNQTLELLKKNIPYDALFLDIHGAMSVVGLDDPEGDYIMRIREIIGNTPIISTCMDLHGNVSPRLAENTDLITCFRTAPHEDRIDSRERAVATLIERLETGKGRPAFKAWIPIPILLPGEQTSTRVEPAKSLYDNTFSASKKEEIIDASIWIGYAWADEPRNHAVVMVTGDDKQQVQNTAEDIANKFWEARHQFEFVAPTFSLEECLAKAFASNKKPFFISDMGDNPTAGGAGDVTWTLTELLKRPEFKATNGKKLVYASIPGPELVQLAKTLGVGKQIKVTAGAAVDCRYAPPVELNGTITNIYEHPTNSEVVVQVDNISVIVTEKRKGFHFVNEFTKLGLDPKNTDIVMVKLGYLTPELYDIQAGWVMALTRGGVDQNLAELPYKRIIRPMFPLDKDMEKPNLSARFIPFVGDKK